MIARLKKLLELRVILFICALLVLIGWILGVVTTYGMALSSIAEMQDATQAAIMDRYGR
jgi:hypothetical protein